MSGLGTSGTLMGVGRYLKEQNPAVQIWAVEPPAGEQVQGLRSLDEGFVPPVFDPDVLDRKLIVRPRESVEWVRRLGEFGFEPQLEDAALHRRHLIAQRLRRVRQRPAVHHRGHGSVHVAALERVLLRLPDRLQLRRGLEPGRRR